MEQHIHNEAVLFDEASHMPLSEFVALTLKNYFAHLDGEKPTQLYPMVVKEVEKGLLKVVMDIAKGNQCVACKMLGLARNTLRKKLKEYQLE